MGTVDNGETSQTLLVFGVFKTLVLAVDEVQVMTRVFDKCPGYLFLVSLFFQPFVCFVIGG